MALAQTPQITASFSLSSPNLTNDSLSLSVQTKLSKAGSADSLSQTTGLARKSYSTAVTNETLYLATDYTDDKSHKIYLRNASTDVTQYVEVTIGSGNIVIGRLYAQDFMYLPWSGNEDIDINTSDNNMIVEHMLIHE